MEWDPNIEPLRRPTAHVSSDLIVYRMRTVRERQALEVLCGERINQPWNGCVTVPFGGYVDPSDVNLLTASQREVEEETGVICSIRFFVGAYGPERWHHTWDGRRAHKTTSPAHVRPVVANVFAARQIGGQLTDSAEQKGLHWVEPKTLTERTLAFDHALALSDFLRILKSLNSTYERRVLARFCRG